MIAGTAVGFTINSKDVPVFPEAVEYARQGVVPGGTGRNREYRQKMVQIGKTVPSFMPDLLFDPQTSGGLLIAVPGEKAGKLLKALHAAGVEEAAVIGEVTAAPKGIIRVV